jgi:predicted deacylase
MDFTLTKVRMRTLASGNELIIPVYRFRGDAGKKVYIQANIHGPEVAGVAALYRLIPLLCQEKAIHGEITVAPSINPVGFDQKFNGLQVGYVDPNEYVVGNFNRTYQMLVRSKPADDEPVDPEDPKKVILEEFVASHMKSDSATIRKDFHAELQAALTDLKAKKGRTGMRHGLKLALTAQEMAFDADCVIDLHTDARGLYYGYSYAENLASFRTFHVPLLIHLSPDDWDGVFDEAFMLPWIKLRRAFKKAGREIPWADFDKEAITLELGNADEVNAQLALEDAQRIMNYLRFKRVLEGEPVAPKGEVLATEFKHRDHYYAPAGGLIFWHKKPGDMVKAGELFGTILRPGEVDARGSAAEVEIRASEPGLLLVVARSHVAHEGLEIASILTHLKPV